MNQAVVIISQVDQTNNDDKNIRPDKSTVKFFFLPSSRTKTHFITCLSGPKALSHFEFSFVFDKLESNSFDRGICLLNFQIKANSKVAPSKFNVYFLSFIWEKNPSVKFASVDQMKRRFHILKPLYRVLESCHETRAVCL